MFVCLSCLSVCLSVSGFVPDFSLSCVLIFIIAAINFFFYRLVQMEVAMDGFAGCLVQSLKERIPHSQLVCMT